jgi:hypothetical protein
VLIDGSKCWLQVVLILPVGMSTNKSLFRQLSSFSCNTFMTLLWIASAQLKPPYMFTSVNNVDDDNDDPKKCFRQNLLKNCLFRIKQLKPKCLYLHGIIICI